MKCSGLQYKIEMSERTVKFSDAGRFNWENFS